MIKIIFCCSWDTNFKKILEQKMLPLTPSNKGIWKNVEAVDNVNDAEWLVILDDLIDKRLIKRFKNNIIRIPREPGNNKIYKFKHFKNYNNFYHCWTSIMCIGYKNYDFLSNFKIPEKNKLCSTITSKLIVNSFYAKRVNFIKKLSEREVFYDKIDIFGYDWTKEDLGKMYKGSLGGFNVGTSNIKKVDHSDKTKWDGLENYHYSICIENCKMKNYFSEKITDCILSWTIPIYCGCPNISDFFPEECYYTIDIESNDCFDKIKEILDKPVTEEQIKALEKARDLILNKYNIWNEINNIINK